MQWSGIRQLAIGRGTIGPGAYGLCGVLFSFLKYLIDWSIAQSFFHRTWTPWDYLVSGTPLNAIMHLADDRDFYLTLLGISLPFIWIGTTLTMARLRSAGASLYLVLGFFLPIINLILFVILVVVGTRKEEPQQAVSDPAPAPVSPAPQPVTLNYGNDNPIAARRFLANWFPQSRLASAQTSIVLTTAFNLLMTWIAVRVFQNFGFSVFVGIPFASGVVAAVLHGLRAQRSSKDCAGVATLSVFISVIAMFVLGFDGAGCLAMFLPLAMPLAALGGVFGHLLQVSTFPDRESPQVLGALILFLPAFTGLECVAKPPAPVFAVVSSVDIDAPPDRVWENVIAFSPMAPPRDWLFKIGIAYPLRATISGTGPGAVRECVFSTGSFIEPITIWDAPRLLKFDVSYNPPPMQEWSPYDIHPAHLHHFLISHAGQFRLIDLGNGRTRLEGTTWYEHNFWPASYWRFWSDLIIHRIHLRVLNHIKSLCESSNRSR